MKLRELRQGPMSAWPPTFGGAYGAGGQVPVDGVGTLKAVEPSRGRAGVHVAIEYEGRTWTGMMQWDGKPSVKRMVVVLELHVGEELRTLANIEVG